jgi:hypothetical protein
MQLSEQLDNVLDIVGVVVPLASLLAGKLNQQIRDAKEAGDPVPNWMFQAVSVLNVLAVNLDKATQLAKHAKAQKLSGASDKAVMMSIVAEVSKEEEKKEEAPKA